MHGPASIINKNRKIVVLIRSYGKEQGSAVPWQCNGIVCQTAMSPICFHVTVKLGDKERFEKEQIGVKEPFPLTN